MVLEAPVDNRLFQSAHVKRYLRILSMESDTLNSNYNEGKIKKIDSCILLLRSRFNTRTAPAREILNQLQFFVGCI